MFNFSFLPPWMNVRFKLHKIKQSLYGSCKWCRVGDNLIPPQGTDTPVFCWDRFKLLCDISNCDLSEMEMLNLAKSCRLARLM